MIIENYPKCLYCGAIFNSHRKSARYCSDSHRTLAYQKRKMLAVQAPSRRPNPIQEIVNLHQKPIEVEKQQANYFGLNPDSPFVKVFGNVDAMLPPSRRKIPKWKR